MVFPGNATAVDTSTTGLIAGAARKEGQRCSRWGAYVDESARNRDRTALTPGQSKPSDAGGRNREQAALGNETLHDVGRNKGGDHSTDDHPEHEKWQSLNADADKQRRPQAELFVGERIESVADQ